MEDRVGLEGMSGWVGGKWITPFQEDILSKCTVKSLPFIALIAVTSVNLEVAFGMTCLFHMEITTDLRPFLFSFSKSRSLGV